MAGTDLVRAPLAQGGLQLDTLGDALALAGQIANTEFVPEALRRRPEAVLACILTGKEVGLPAMASLAKIFVVKGRPVMSAEAMRALVLAQGHEIWVEERTASRVVVAGMRDGSTHEATRVTWTIDDAKRAGLAGKEVWRAYPAQMLTARATTDLCRLLFPDVLGGIAYSLEEADDIPDLPELDAPPLSIEGAQPADPGTTSRTATPTARQTRSAGKAGVKKARAALAARGGPPPSSPPEPPLPGEEDDQAPAAPTGAAPPAAPDDGGPTLPLPNWIAMHCTNLGVDRHALISAVTGGRTESAKSVTTEEGRLVVEHAKGINRGELHLEHDGERWLLLNVHAQAAEPDEDDSDLDDVAAEPEPDDGLDPGRPFDDPPAEPKAEPPVDVEPEGAEATWDGDQWKEAIRAAGLKQGEALLAFRNIAVTFEEEPAPSLNAMKDRSPRLCQAARAWIEDPEERSR